MEHTHVPLSRPSPQCTADNTQETAKLEAQAYELEQKTAIAHEAKSVLDSWVRYEGQVKQRQQRELAESIIAKIEKELESPKTLKSILDQSVADVERAYTTHHIQTPSANPPPGIVAQKA